MKPVKREHVLEGRGARQMSLHPWEQARDCGCISAGCLPACLRTWPCLAPFFFFFLFLNLLVFEFTTQNAAERGSPEILLLMRLSAHKGEC